MSDNSQSTVVSVVICAALVVVGFMVWYKYQMYQKDNEIKEVKKAYLGTVIERSKKPTKTVYTYAYEHNDNPRETSVDTYTITDAGLKIDNVQKSVAGSVTNWKFYWFGDFGKIEPCYVGKDDFCICHQGPGDNFTLKFRKGIERDEFFKALAVEHRNFRNKYKVLYDRE